MNFKIGDFVKVNNKYYNYCDNYGEFLGDFDDDAVREIEGNSPGLVAEMIYYIGKKIKISQYEKACDYRGVIYFSEETGLWWGDWQLDKASKLKLE